MVMRDRAEAFRTTPPGAPKSLMLARSGEIGNSLKRLFLDYGHREIKGPWHEAVERMQGSFDSVVASHSRSNYCAQDDRGAERFGKGRERAGLG
jgi:hypothetical protein